MHDFLGSARALPRLMAMLVAIAASMAVRFLASVDPAASACASSVGFRTILVPAAAGGRPEIRVAVWYPTTRLPAPHRYARPSLNGLVSECAPVRSGQHPILLFSHGSGNSAIGYPYLTEGLARRGWIVAAPDYPDRYVGLRMEDSPVRAPAGVRQPDGAPLCHAEPWTHEPGCRPSALRRSLEGVLRDPDLGPRIDRGRAALAGHSIGAATSLALCGLDGSLEMVHVKAAALLSPGGPVLPSSLIERVRLPVLLMHGETETAPCRRAPDGTLLSIRQANLRNFDALAGPVEMLELAHGTHYSFESPLDPQDPHESGSEDQLHAILDCTAAFLAAHVVSDGAQVSMRAYEGVVGRLPLIRDRRSRATMGPKLASCRLPVR